MKTLFGSLIRNSVFIIIALAGGAPAAHSANPEQNLSPPKPQLSTGNARVIQFRSDMKPGRLLARSDKDVIDFGDGRRMKIGDLR